MTDFKKSVYLGVTADKELITVKIEFVAGILRFTGNIGRANWGQIVFSPWEITSYAPGIDADTVQKLRAIWEDWHLNDMQAGSPMQTAYLKAHPVDRTNHYTAATEALKAAGLNPDANFIHAGKPYKYGTAWLKVEVPDDVAQWLNNLPI